MRRAIALGRSIADVLDELTPTPIPTTHHSAVSISVTQYHDHVEITSFGDVGKTYVAGLPRYRVLIRAFYVDGLDPNAQYFDVNNTWGGVHYQGRVLVHSLRILSEIDNALMVEIDGISHEFQVTPV